MDTIYALATPPGRSALAIIRISGPGTGDILSALSVKMPCPIRTPVLSMIRNPETQDILDQAVILNFKAPSSFTGEDAAEITLHGGPAVVAGVMEALSKTKKCRMAEPGEFTKRAFLNNKMDLTQAEAIADLTSAETRLQRRQALSQLSGSLKDIYDGFRDQMVRIGAYTEAHLDFPDEDLPTNLLDQVRPQIETLIKNIKEHLSDAHVGERVRDGFKTVIIGPPNAGKSTLLNALSSRDVAIVSPIPGTTRDVIDVHLDVGGYPVVLSDTAGIRSGTSDIIEAEGMRRAGQRIKESDIQIFVFDVLELLSGGIDFSLFPNPMDGTILVLNKVDQIQDEGASAKKIRDMLPSSFQGVPHVMTSLQEKGGVDKITSAIRTYLEKISAGHEGAVLTRARHREALMEVLSSLETASCQTEPELLSEELRAAIQQMGRITGRVDIDDILDIIFRDFCIGK